MFNKKRQLGLLIAAICVAIDFWSKNLILRTVEDGAIEVIPGFFNLVLAFNRGVSFSMLSDVSADNLPYVLAGISAAASLFFIYVMKKDIHILSLVGFGLILGGAVGNMVDRFRFGAVVDFLDFYYDKWHFPAFNAADTFISIGVAFILLDAILDFLKERKEKCKQNS
jgi:signal peptidase II